MIYQIFSIVLSAVFLMCMFWALWYIAIPLLAIMILMSTFNVFVKKIKRTIRKRQTIHSIHANDIIDVDFKEVN